MVNSATPSRAVLLAAIFPVLAIMVGLQANPQSGQAMSVLLAVLVYFVTMIAYYAMGRLATAQHTHLLWSTAAVALVMAFMLTGVGDTWPVLMGLSAVLAGGVIGGRLIALGWHPRKVYTWSVLAVVALTVIQLAPLWSAVQLYSGELIEETLQQFRQTAALWTTNSAEIEEAAGSYSRVMKVFIHLLPAMTVLSGVLQFTVGYLLLTRYVARSWPHLSIQMAFVRWRMPFALTPLVVAAVGARLTGHESAMMVADNVLVLLAVFYAACGMALIETYLRRLAIPKALKAIFWVLLALTHLIGFFVTGLLGFIDSFFDFRRRAAAAAEAP
ncbi:MAG: DUF2232 domain-containing protein [bacterium]